MSSKPQQEISKVIKHLEVAKILQDVLTEVDNATGKFPTWPTDPIHAVGVIQEESGELQKEVLQLCYEPDKSEKEDVRKEAIQLAAMAIRFLLSFDKYQFKPGEQHGQ